MEAVGLGLDAALAAGCLRAVELGAGELRRPGGSGGGLQECAGVGAAEAVRPVAKAAREPG